MVTARVVTKNKSTAVKRKDLHGWLFKEICVANAYERHKCISKCCNPVKMSMSLRYRACWSCVSGSCCWLLRNQRASSNYCTINTAAGAQTKGETSALGVKFSGWHGVVTYPIAVVNFVGIILRFNLYNLKVSIRVKHFARQVFTQIHRIDKRMRLSPHFWQRTINFFSGRIFLRFHNFSVCSLVGNMWSHLWNLVSKKSILNC